MYQLLSDISNFFSGPIFSFLNDDTLNLPLLAALLLGIVGSLAPCQLTSNFAAMTFFSNQSVNNKSQGSEIFYFILGKILVYSILGSIIWLLGKEIQTELTVYFSYFRKWIPLVNVLIGLYLLGYLNLFWLNKFLKIKIANEIKGKLGAFLMGFSYSLAFCPTMFVLFFVTLVPIILSTSYGYTLPAIFGFGTGIPLIILHFIILSFGLEGSLLRKGKYIGKIIQKVAGLLILLLGLIDFITYW